jgi:hypothetical protein
MISVLNLDTTEINNIINPHTEHEHPKRLFTMLLNNSALSVEVKEITI